MNHQIIERLINYWIASSEFNFPREKRLKIPGFDFKNTFKNIYEIESELSEKIIKSISQVNHNKVNRSSIKKWDDGWGQNLRDIRKNKSIEPYIVPYYFGKYPLSRVLGKLISSSSFKLPKDIDQIQIPKWDMPTLERWNSLEHNLVRLMMHNLIYIPFFQEIIKSNYKEIYFYEFGAGTTHNLYFLEKFVRFYLPEINAKFIALDWSKSTGEIIESLGSNFKYEFINYYEPESFPEIKENSFIFSLASLEQINISSERIINYIADSKPKIVINIEPIYQTLSKNSPVDMQSIKYMKDRNYLPDFLSSLLRIKMLHHNNLDFKLFRSGIGSQFIDGYSVVQWGAQ